MDDTISREAAIDALLHNQEIYSNNFGTDAIDKYTIAIIDNDVQTIAQLPSAQRWIPVSERLPKPDEEVFIYLWGNVPHLASVNSEGQWETDQFYLDADDTPKAWMPLPEPWKGGEG